MNEYLRQLLEVNYLLSGKNKLYNFEEWKTGKRPLFIVGLSGAGKSTLGRKLSQDYKAEYIELDSIDKKFRKQMMKRYGLDRWNEKINELTYQHMKKYFDNLERSNRRVIVEGIHILYYPDYKYFKGKSVIIMGLSVLLSSLRAFKRNKAKYGDKHSLYEIIEDILRNQRDFIKRLKKFEKSI